VGPRAGQDAVEKRKFLILPGLELRPFGRQSRSQSLCRLSYPGRPILASLCFTLDSRNITLYSSAVNALSDLFIMHIDGRLVPSLYRHVTIRRILAVYILLIHYQMKSVHTPILCPNPCKPNVCTSPL
jgi:hypothetical protein